MVRQTGLSGEKVGIDVDGVLFDFHRFTCELLAREGHDVCLTRLHGHDIDFFPGVGERVIEIVESDDTYLTTEPLDAGFDMLADLLDSGVECEALTARPRHMWYLTERRLYEEFKKRGIDHEVPFVKAFGHTKEKAKYVLANGFTAMVEDNPRMGKLLLEAGWSADNFFLFEQTWNRDWEEYPNRRKGHEIAKILVQRHKQVAWQGATR